MKKNQKIIIIILAVVLALCAAFAGLSLNSGFMKKITGSLDASSGNGKSMSEVAVANSQTDYPLVQTQQKDVFYEANPDGTIKFYKFADNNFSEITDVKTKSTSLDCSYQTVKVKLYYISTQAGTVGYGLFDSKQDSDTKLFSYVFVRMMDCPSSYKTYAKTDYILLTDMDSEDSYKTDKTYSDIYSYNMSSNKASLIMSQRDRTVQSDGTFSENWTIYTDSMLNEMNKSDLFASARNYDTVKGDNKYDFLSVVNSRSMKKSTAATVVGSPSYHIWEKDGGYYCLVNTKEGFDLIKNSDKDAPIASFTGSFSDYAISGDWILNKSTLEFTNVFSGESKAVKKATFDTFSGFIANDSGTKFILFCPGDSQSMIMYDTENDKAEIVSGSDIFNSGICNFSFVDDSTFVVSTYGENNIAINQICTF